MNTSKLQTLLTEQGIEIKSARYIIKNFPWDKLTETQKDALSLLYGHVAQADDLFDAICVEINGD